MADPGFADALRTAIDARAVSLQWLHDRLVGRATPVSIATLSYWRSGQRTPEHRTSLDAVAQIEELLDLDVGALSDHLGRSRRVPPEHAIPFDTLIERDGALAPVLERLGLDREDELAETSCHVTVDIDDRGRLIEMSSRIVWRARRDGADTIPVYFVPDDPDAVVPKVEPIAGCEIGNLVHDEASGIVGTCLVLGRPLSLGETTVTEHRIVPAEGTVEDDRYELVARRRLVEGMTWVRFQGRVPSRCWAYAIDETGRIEQPLEPVGNSAHHVRRGFGPGRIGVRWEW